MGFFGFYRDLLFKKKSKIVVSNPQYGIMDKQKAQHIESEPNKLMRVWWNSNFGQPAFKKDVKNIREAKYIINLLTQYDLYLGDKIVSNACGLEVFDYEWREWEDENGQTITQIIDEEEKIRRENEINQKDNS